jgi:hypothetical protein
MSELTPDDVREVIPGIPLLDGPLQELIDDEEAWLAARIGPLSGERAQVFREVRSVQNLRLQRPADTDYTVEDNGVDVTADTFRLRAGWRIGRTLGTYWSIAYPTSIVEVTYTPTDAADVRRAEFTLIRLALASYGSVVEGVNQVTIGSFSYSLGTGSASPRQLRAALLRSLREPAEPETLRVRSSAYPEPPGRWPP